MPFFAVGGRVEGGTRLARHASVTLKPLSVEVCVRALESCGFELKQRGDGFTVLRLEQRVVVVPGLGVLDAEMQQAILRSAGVDEPTFRRHIASQSGLFTRLDVESVSADVGAKRG